MLMPLPDLISRFDLHITGILHIGAHHAEELESYEECKIPRVVWVEGDPNSYARTCERIEGLDHHSAYRALLDSTERTVDFHVANNGQSSSILELGTHLQHHPEVAYIGTTSEQTSTIDGVFSAEELQGLNFWNLDVQGVELGVLQGGKKALEACSYIYTEVNNEEVYVNCAMVSDLDAYLSDFKRVATEWTPHQWGDALYIRKDLL